MRKIEGHYHFSPTDLSNFLGCRHATSLDMKRAAGELEVPIRRNARLDRLAEKGLLHEESYLRSLVNRGLRVERLGDFDDAQITVDKMSEGVDVIFQGSLQSGLFAGRSDFLIRVNEPSELGDWSYEVVDTKLSQNTKAGTVLQLCCYSDCVAAIQGRRGNQAHVVKPAGKGGQEVFETETLWLDSYWAYFQLVKRQMIEATSDGRLHQLYPDPVPHCDVCRWFPYCDTKRRGDDHLSFIAGVQTSQISEIRRQGHDTLAGFASASNPIPERPMVGSAESLRRVHRQAKVQQLGRDSGENIIEYLPMQNVDARAEQPTKPMGFLRLPEPDAGDVFLDFEGDPHAPDGVLEYLFGYVTRDGAGQHYHSDWCLSRTEERNAFAKLMQFLLKRRQDHPHFHIYHFAPYEPAAMKRMAMRHQLFEAELDELLRSESFVDLYAVVRQSMVLSVESYSIKKLEAFYGFVRDADLREVRDALNDVERAIELDLIALIDSDTRDLVETYNRDDCISTLKLHRWLESKRSELVNRGNDIPRPDHQPHQPNDDTIQRKEDFRRLRDELKSLAGEEGSNSTKQGRWLMAHLLEYFFREDKTVWWEYFRHLALEDNDLLYENAAIAGLEFVEQIAPIGIGTMPTSVYRYPPQDHGVRKDQSVYHRDRRKIGTVVEVDHSHRIVQVKKAGNTIDFHPTSLFVHDLVGSRPMPAALLELGREVAEASWDPEVVRSARYDLLTRRSPQLSTLSLPHGENYVDAAIAIATDLDRGVLPIQGPPGSGKTFVASRMIVSLARQGFKVGVTAVSHKVILNLLQRAREYDREETCTFARKPKSGDTEEVEGIHRLRNNAEAIDAVRSGTVVGGTSWLWSSDAAKEQLDYLFIDEAGQMSLAMALAAARSAKNLILLGDPQQLEQPQRAAHPEGSEVAALAHLIGDHATIPDDRGLFLSETYRLHPDVCDFTSEQFYDSRLSSKDECRHNRILGDGAFGGSGLRYVAVDHRGNQNRSEEEVEVVQRIVSHLLEGSICWTDKEQNVHPITPNNLLIVAPYNAQVDALAAVVGDRARIGTVDKFQGQEAPIVIYSTASSSAEDAPRGMEFLYDPHRLNVATSRSMCMTILVASPRLLEPQCRSPRQMKLANTFCRFAELAKSVTI